MFVHQRFVISPRNITFLTWWATVVEAVVAAVAEGMFENTLDVVKLEPRDRRKNLFYTV